MTSQTPEETPRKDFGFEPKHPDGLPNIEKDCTTDCPWCDGYPPCEYRIGYNDGFNTLHHQLQKARQDWLREEIVKLKQEQKDMGTKISIVDYYKLGYFAALQTIIDRYHSELDQEVGITSEDKKD